MTLQKWMFASILGAALAALIFFGVATWVIWPYQGLPAAAVPLVKAWTPKPGAVDQGLTAIAEAMPAPGAIDKIANEAVKAMDSFAGVGPAATAAIDTTAQNLNRKCSGPSGPEACGTLAEINKTVIDAGDAIKQTQLEELAASRQVVTTMAELDGDGKDLDLDLRDPAIHNAAANLAIAETNLAIAESTGNGILLDVKKETDQMAAPKTKAQKLFGWLPTAVKLGAIGACLATGTPCP
jgi:hypothetical protein